MKKIISLIFALLMVVTMASAQTVVRNGVFSNMYVGVNGGAIHSTVSNYDNFDFKNLNYNGALEIGKNVTPITGFSLVGEMLPTFEDGFKVNATNLTGNVKFNLMNLFGRYKGYPRRFEIQTVTGIGWDHNFNSEVSNPNDMSLNGGLEFDFNLGKQRAWYITFTPMVVSHNVIRNYSEIEPMVKNADLQANLGVAYRFGSKKTGSHNFVICPYTYTDEQYAELYAMYDECMNRPATVDTVVVEKIVEVVKTESVNYPTETYVYFEKGSSELDARAERTINDLVKVLPANMGVKVIGSADSKTGSNELNQKLSGERANKVVETLKKLGIKDIDFENVLDINENPELSRSAVILVVE